MTRLPPLSRPWRDYTHGRRNYAAPDRRGLVIGTLPWQWLLGHALAQAGYMAQTAKEADFAGYMAGLADGKTLAATVFSGRSG